MNNFCNQNHPTKVVKCNYLQVEVIVVSSTLSFFFFASQKWLLHYADRKWVPHYPVCIQGGRNSILAMGWKDGCGAWHWSSVDHVQAVGCSWSDCMYLRTSRVKKRISNCKYSPKLSSGADSVFYYTFENKHMPSKLSVSFFIHH